jgi:hypothetical protein
MDLNLRGVPWHAPLFLSPMSFPLETENGGTALLGAVVCSFRSMVVMLDKSIPSLLRL